MGTDRTEIYSNACPCGRGEIVINLCTPDHGWRTRSSWLEAGIECRECSTKYEIVVQDQYYVLTTKTEYERAYKQARDIDQRINATYQAIAALPETGALVNKFREMLETQSSQAARHRILKSSGLDHSSLAVFRRRWPDPFDWVRENVNLFNLDKVMAALDTTDAKIKERLLDIEGLITQREEVSRQPLSYIGQPILKVPLN